MPRRGDGVRRRGALTVSMAARAAPDDSRTWEALRILARLLGKRRGRLDAGEELRLHGSELPGEGPDGKEHR